MIHTARRRMKRAALLIGLSQFLGIASAWAQSCAALDPSKAARCRGLEEQEKILSTNCRVPGAATAEQAASICAQARANVQADKRALFAGPTPSPRAQPVFADSQGLQPLPVTSAPAKPPVLRGFYIGMPMQEALAAASIALAPWPAVYRVQKYTKAVAIYLRSGPKGVWTLDACVASSRDPSGYGRGTPLPSLENALSDCVAAAPISSTLVQPFAKPRKTQSHGILPSIQKRANAICNSATARP